MRGKKIGRVGSWTDGERRGGVHHVISSGVEKSLFPPETEIL